MLRVTTGKKKKISPQDSCNFFPSIAVQKSDRTLPSDFNVVLTFRAEAMCVAPS